MSPQDLGRKVARKIWNEMPENEQYLKAWKVPDMGEKVFLDPSSFVAGNLSSGHALSNRKVCPIVRFANRKVCPIVKFVQSVSNQVWPNVNLWGLCNPNLTKCKPVKPQIAIPATRMYF